MDRISIHNRNYKVRTEVREYIEKLQAKNELLKSAIAYCSGSCGGWLKLKEHTDG